MTFEAKPGETEPHTELTGSNVWTTWAPPHGKIDSATRLFPHISVCRKEHGYLVLGLLEKQIFFITIIPSLSSILNWIVYPRYAIGDAHKKIKNFDKLRRKSIMRYTHLFQRNLKSLTIGTYFSYLQLTSQLDVLTSPRIGLIQSTHMQPTANWNHDANRTVKKVFLNCNSLLMKKNQLQPLATHMTHESQCKSNGPETTKL